MSITPEIRTAIERLVKIGEYLNGYDEEECQDCGVLTQDLLAVAPLLEQPENDPERKGKPE